MEWILLQMIKNLLFDLGSIWDTSEFLTKNSIIFWLFRVPPIRSPSYLRGADKTRSEITNIPCPTLNSGPSGDAESPCSVLTTSLALALLLWSEVRTVRHESPSTPSA